MKELLDSMPDLVFVCARAPLGFCSGGRIEHSPCYTDKPLSFRSVFSHRGPTYHQFWHLSPHYPIKTSYFLFSSNSFSSGRPFELFFSIFIPLFEKDPTKGDEFSWPGNPTTRVCPASPLSPEVVGSLRKGPGRDFSSPAPPQGRPMASRPRATPSAPTRSSCACRGPASNPTHNRLSDSVRISPLGVE